MACITAFSTSLKLVFGPSSSHTVGPMVAANLFLKSINNISDVESVKVDVYGSLALTGFGHATDKALLMGLEGQEPATIDPAIIDGRCEEIRNSNRLKLLGDNEISFVFKDHMLFHMEELLPHHSNGLTFSAFDGNGKIISKDNYYSVGGGAVMSEADFWPKYPSPDEVPVPYPFNTGKIY